MITCAQKVDVLLLKVSHLTTHDIIFFANFFQFRGIHQATKFQKYLWTTTFRQR